MNRTAKSSRLRMQSRRKRRPSQVPALVEKINEVTAEAALMPNRAWNNQRRYYRRRADAVSQRQAEAEKRKQCIILAHKRVEKRLAKAIVRAKKAGV